MDIYSYGYWARFLTIDGHRKRCYLPSEQFKDHLFLIIKYYRDIKIISIFHNGIFFRSFYLTVDDRIRFCIYNGNIELKCTKEQILKALIDNFPLTYNENNIKRISRTIISRAIDNVGIQII